MLTLPPVPIAVAERMSRMMKTLKNKSCKRKSTSNKKQTTKQHAANYKKLATYISLYKQRTTTNKPYRRDSKIHTKASEIQKAKLAAKAIDKPQKTI